MIRIFAGRHEGGEVAYLASLLTAYTPPPVTIAVLINPMAQREPGTGEARMWYGGFGLGCVCSESVSVAAWN